MKSHDNNGNHPEDLLDRSISALRNAPVPDGPGPRTTADTLAALRRVAGEDRIPMNPVGSIGLVQRSLAMIFAHKKIAASLTFIVGGLAVWSMLSLFSSVTYAQVAEKIRSAHSVFCTATLTLTGKQTPIGMKLYFQEPGKRRVENDQGVTVSDQATGTLIHLDSVSKKAVIVKLHSYGFPDDFITELRGLVVDSKSTPIQDKQIGDVQAKGFKVTKEKQEASFWVDPKTGMPLQVEMSWPGAVRLTLNNLEFDKPLEASLFSLEAPEGYLVTRQESNEPPAMEENALGMLRLYAEKSNGMFPAAIDDWSAFAKLAAVGKNPNQLDAESQQLMSYAGTLTRQTIPLVKGTDYEYLPGAKLGDTETIVFWYRDKNKGTYRAIYADLSVKELKTRDVPPPVKKTVPLLPLPTPVPSTAVLPQPTTR